MDVEACVHEMLFENTSPASVILHDQGFFEGYLYRQWFASQRLEMKIAAVDAKQRLAEGSADQDPIDDVAELAPR